MKPSSIPGAGLGVFATDTIPRGVRFGAYMGKKVPASHVDEDYDTSYMWEVHIHVYTMYHCTNVYALYMCIYNVHVHVYVYVHVCVHVQSYMYTQSHLRQLIFL